MIRKSNQFGERALTSSGHEIVIIAEDDSNFYFCPPEYFEKNVGKIDWLKYAKEFDFRIAKSLVRRHDNEIADKVSMIEQEIEKIKKRHQKLKESYEELLKSMEKFNEKTAEGT